MASRLARTDDFLWHLRYFAPFSVALFSMESREYHYMTVTSAHKVEAIPVAAGVQQVTYRLKLSDPFAPHIAWTLVATLRVHELGHQAPTLTLTRESRPAEAFLLLA